MNIKCNYLLINNALDYFAKLFSDNEKIINVINKKNKIASKLNYYEDAFKNDEFEIEIIFPFKQSEIKMSSIEKIKEFIFTHKVMNLS